MSVVEVFLFIFGSMFQFFIDYWDWYLLIGLVWALYVAHKAYYNVDGTWSDDYANYKYLNFCGRFVDEACLAWLFLCWPIDIIIHIVRWVRS